MGVEAKVTCLAIVCLGCVGDLTDRVIRLLGSPAAVNVVQIWKEFVRGLGRDIDKDVLLKLSGKMCRRCPHMSATRSCIFILYKCCCMHLLAISKVLEALEHPLQSYGAFCPCNFTCLKANGKGKFCGATKWLPLIPGSSSVTERYANFLLSHFLALAQWP